MIRLGLCCIFKEQPITFKQTTAKSLKTMDRAAQLNKLGALILHNLQGVQQALHWLNRHYIKAFRIMSPLFPRYTHPEVAYNLEELPCSEDIFREIDSIHTYGKKHHFRLSLHPDQFNVLSSPSERVVENTVRELEYQGLLAELLGAEVINIHGGGAYGDKSSALNRFSSNFKILSDRVKTRLTIENDDVTYTPEDLLPLCRKIGRPLVYDVHHHRCHRDNLSIVEATEASNELWRELDQEPYFHISSPREGWEAKDLRPHADYINFFDIPDNWLDLDATVDVEAKAKELAVLELQSKLVSHCRPVDRPQPPS